MAGFFSPSDLARLDIDKTTFTIGNILHLVVTRPKERRHGQPIWRSVAIDLDDNPVVCPVQLYKDYCTRFTQVPCMIDHPILPNTRLNALVRATNNPSQALSPNAYLSMSNESRCMLNSLLPRFQYLKPEHSVQLAALNGTSVDQILAHGNWSPRAIFEIFYRISVSNNTNYSGYTTKFQLEM